MPFGKAFKTRKEAIEHLRKIVKTGDCDGVGVRKMSKKLFPRRKKLFHVGSFIEFLNFA